MMNKYFNYNLSTHSNTISIDETININTIVLFTLLKIYIKYAEYILYIKNVISMYVLTKIFSV